MISSYEIGRASRGQSKYSRYDDDDYEEDDYEDDDYDDEDSTTYENIPSAPAEEKEEVILKASPAGEAFLPPQPGWAPT